MEKSAVSVNVSVAVKVNNLALRYALSKDRFPEPLIPEGEIVRFQLSVVF